MANNIDIKDAAEIVKTTKTTDTGGVHVAHVNVDSIPAIPAGSNNIGDVDVLTLPALPAGTNNIGDVDVLTLPALVAGTANIGDVDVLTLPALPAGTNNIGDVDVLTLPALVSGTANIGRVGNEFTSGTISNADVDALEEVATISVAPYNTLFVTFTVAAAALSDFDIDVRAHSSGGYITLFGASADYLVPVGFLLWVSGDLTVAPTSGTHGFVLDVSCFESVRISAAGTSSVISGHYGAK